MDNIQCPDCCQTFCSRYNLRRHHINKHRTTIDATDESPQGVQRMPPQGAHFGAPGAHLETQGAHGAHLGAQGAPGAQRLSQQACSISTYTPQIRNRDVTKDTGGPLILLHPFTMMISGPTACGKTTFVKDLLQNHTVRVHPCIQRIVWLYKRWQPLYDVIRSTVTPKVEFVQGIPTELDDDDFFDPRVNNLLILDDLFSESGKDKRVTDLFTEGSHHRSLSVISINQNLFGNKDPTQRRNCHYLVLFDNPVDRQSLLTLARQMYPGHTDKFMNSFGKATKSSPFKFLLVDLKPYTKEDQRLKHDVTWQDQVAAKPELTNRVPEIFQKTIKEIDASERDHCSIGVQTESIVNSSEIYKYLENNTEDMSDKGQACDDCGLLFDSAHDVQRHVKRGWCPENNEPTPKKRKHEEVDERDEDVDVNEGYKQLWQLAQSCNKDRFGRLYDQYLDEGENEDDATEMATQRIQPYNEKSFFQRYQWLLETYWFPLRSNTTHRSIVEQIDNLRSKGVSLTSAVKRVLKKTKNDFEDLFELENEEDSDEDSDISESGDEIE